MTQPPPPGGPPQGAVELNVQGSALTSSMVPPTVRINGAPVPVGYGRRLVPVWAGPVRIDAECSWMWKYGQASLEFIVAPGQTVPVYYATPLTTWAPGSIGHVPQKRNGLLPLVLIFGGIGLFFLLVVVLAIAL
ncbi:hypothetical protein [Nocardioides panacisoli]|uniref:DUF3592 domain-containing protein n=1 Tax=Nocardioides panacisoli TaxID=627624 RepID=A0ABP7IE56_9ACTN